MGSSVCHAHNVPLVYNPGTTHVTPQFHVVFDEGFTSLTNKTSDVRDKVLEKLYNKALWTHSSEYAEPHEHYYYDSFWMDPPLAPPPEGRGRKRQCEPLSQLAPEEPILTQGAVTNDNNAPRGSNTSEGVNQNMDNAPRGDTSLEGASTLPFPAPAATGTAQGATLMHNSAPSNHLTSEGATTQLSNGHTDLTYPEGAPNLSPNQPHSVSQSQTAAVTFFP